jgi:hypothetical protein
VSERVESWLESVSGRDWLWYVKTLSGNDTLATGAHQAGPYIPKQVVFRLFPSLQLRDSELNPRVVFPVEIDSHGTRRDVNLIWYNNRITGGSRDECRVTSWGGAASPVLDPDATGAICVMAFFKPNADADAEECRLWIAADVDEENTIQDWVGAVEPGHPVLHHPFAERQEAVTAPLRDSPCTLSEAELPAEWRLEFPDATAIVQRAVANLPTVRQRQADDRLLKRRDCEFELYRSIEQLLVLPRVREGFATVDLFVGYSLSVTNRRKSRSGASLELQTRTIFDEDGLNYSHDERSEGRKRPDFLFPSVEAYQNPGFPEAKLRMLAVKTTCKDRWRQILNEADRIESKHLLTLQQGVSENQFAEMKAANVRLVVPQKLHSFFPKQIRGQLVTLSDFIQSTKATCTK